MRLTNKLKNGYFPRLFGLEEIYTNKQRIDDFDRIVQKLGQHEDIEDELGIELVILFNALRNGIYYRMSSGQITKDYVYLISNNISIGQVSKLDYSFMTCFERHILLFIEYGKTWALTKEELL